MSVSYKDTKQLKQALEGWKSRLEANNIAVTPEMESLTKRLIDLYVDNLQSPSPSLDDEIARVAQNLAILALDGINIKTLRSRFRDDLLKAITENVPSDGQTLSRSLHFANLISDAFSTIHTERLRKLIRRQRTTRLKEELHLAKQIQERLLPKSIPEIPGFQIAGRMQPAFDVGGDYWSVKYYPKDDRATVKLADISGHGIAAATLVAAVKFISGGYYRGAKSAHEVIEQTNRVLVKETPVEVLVTMVYAWLYPKTREVDVVNAGHEPVFICKKNSCIDIPPTGPLLGVEETMYHETRIKLDPGDILFFCSDGITEAGVGEQFGIARVKNLVLVNSSKTAEEIADELIRTATEFAGKPHDDMSVVIVKAIDENN